MKRIYIDMDDTLCDYSGAHKEMRELHPNVKYPQSIQGFFYSLEPLNNAIEAVNLLRQEFEVYILTRPSYKNPGCYSEKRLWIEKHFGLEFCKNLIICSDKSLLKGDYLIDDCEWPGFEGKQLQFGKNEFKDWMKVLYHFKMLHKLLKIQE